MSKLPVYRTYFHDFLVELVQSNFCDGRKIGLNLNLRSKDILQEDWSFPHTYLYYTKCIELHCTVYYMLLHLNQIHDSLINPNI